MRSAAVTILVLTAGLLASLLPLRTARAGDEDRSPDQARQRIEFLVRESRALEGEGRTDAAHLLLQRAEELKRRARAEKEARGRTPLRPDEARRVLRGLRAGIAALGRIHRPHEQEAVARIARELEARMRGAGMDEEQAHEAREAREREQAKRRMAGAKKRFALLQLAAKAFREAENHEAVERLEVAMHAMKLRLEGRRDEEAGEVYAEAPRGDETRKLLRKASEIWARMGHEEEAATLGAVTGKTADKTAEKAKKVKKAKTKARAKRQAERPESAASTPKKVKRLGAQIKRLAKGLDALRHELNDLRKQLAR